MANMVAMCALSHSLHAAGCGNGPTSRPAGLQEGCTIAGNSRLQRANLSLWLVVHCSLRVPRLTGGEEMAEAEHPSCCSASRSPHPLSIPAACMK
jgi:hypothetical protein